MRPMKLLSAVILPLMVSSAVSLAGPGIGDPAPDFTEVDTAYVPRSLSEFRGNVILLNFWWSG